jgi:hypothetical protein
MRLGGPGDPELALDLDRLGDVEPEGGDGGGTCTGRA